MNQNIMAMLGQTRGGNPYNGITQQPNMSMPPPVQSPQIGGMMNMPMPPQQQMPLQPQQGMGQLPQNNTQQPTQSPNWSSFNPKSNFGMSR